MFSKESSVCAVASVPCAAVPPIATELLRRTELTLRANRVLTRRSKIRRYSINSSARMRSDSGTSSPSVLAVLRFTSNSTLVGCSTGRSAGLVPLRI
jgi:hypothetical protein